MRIRDIDRLTVDFYRSVKATAGLDVILPDNELVEQALEEYLFKFDDKRFSVVDAVSFLVMNRLGLRRVLTLDNHFPPHPNPLPPGERG